MLDRRIRQGWSHSGSCYVFGDVEAAKLSGPSGDVGIWAGQYIRVADDPTAQFRNEDRRVRAELSEPFCEVGGGFLHGQGGHVRLCKEIAVTPSAGGNADPRDCSGVGWSRRPNDEVASHKHRVVSDVG
jgi:hypothetical protein